MTDTPKKSGGAASYEVRGGAQSGLVWDEAMQSWIGGGGGAKGHARMWGTGGNGWGGASSAPTAVYEQLPLGVVAIINHEAGTVLYEPHIEKALDILGWRGACWTNDGMIRALVAKIEEFQK